MEATVSDVSARQTGGRLELAVCPVVIEGSPCLRAVHEDATHAYKRAGVEEFVTIEPVPESAELMTAIVEEVRGIVRRSRRRMP